MEFEVVSGAIQATDPCYTCATWCSKTIENVKNGYWFASIETADAGEWGARVAILAAYHGTADTMYIKWKRVEGDFGVDSGQFGFFDFEYFQDHQEEREASWTEDAEGVCIPNEGAGFYAECCCLTLNKDCGGGGIVANRGVVSSTGYGDGSYPVYIGLDENDKVIAVRVDFMGEVEYDLDENSEDEYDYDCE